jgi:hypothetical protein
MPGDLKDPEQSIPFHYDPKYDQVPGPNGPGADDTCNYLQSIIMENLGIRLSPEKLDLIIDELHDKGFFHRNPGDETFRDEVLKLTKRIAMARRVARRCLI